MPEAEGTRGIGSSTEPDASDPANDPVPDAGGNGAVQECEQASGVYEPLYTALSGDCGPLTDANNVPVQNGLQIQKFAAVDIETETAVMGCSVTLLQTVLDKQGAPQKKIMGTLRIDSATKLSGEVSLTRYDSNGFALCAGTYDATLPKATTLGDGAR